MSAASEALVPAWLLELFPASQDRIDPTAYEERVGRMVHEGGLPESWVRGGLVDLQGGDWQDRVLRFADNYAPDLTALGWQFGDLFPQGELDGPDDHMRGLGWALLDALDAGGAVVDIAVAHIVYATARGKQAVIHQSPHL